MSNLRDKLWLWGHPANSHFAEYNITQRSRMTPAEAAFYMGIPNLIMVKYRADPQPPYEQYLMSLSPLKRVVWSIVGASGHTEASDREAVFEAAPKFPNVTGVMMDDFFASTGAKGKTAVMDPVELRQVRARLRTAGAGGSKLDLWVVLYDVQLDLPIREHLAEVDAVSYWTWKAKDLAALEQRFTQAAELAPHARRVLGCYMYDYGDSKPMPVELMAMQCDLGLRWLKEGRIDGMIFLASCICDLRLEAVEFTRDWIARHGDRDV